METILRFGLFLVSMTGYILYITQRYRIRVAYAPALFCAWTSNVLFAAGILNILPHAVWLLFAGGIFCLILSACSRKDLIWHDTGSLLRYVLFLTIVIYFFRLLHGAHFTSYDNFSHWATVVKDMLLQERMPNFEDAVIRFQSYPLGSSLFLYYACKIIGTSDGCMLWAQFLMLSGFLFVLAALVRKRNGFQILFVLLCSIWILSANNSIYELRVDTLLPTAAVAAFVILYQEREKPEKAIDLAMGLFMLLVNIKNSGIFFYLACILFFAMYHRKKFLQYKKPFLVAGLLAPLSVLFLWKRHVAFAFSDGMSSKHSMNLAHFKEMANKKTPEDMLEIGREIGRRFTEIGNVEVTLLLSATAFVLILLVLTLLLAGPSGPWKKLLRLLAAVWGCFAIYTISLYAMYIFSMPMGESAHLASYDRYILSVWIFLYGIITAVVLDIWNALADCREKERQTENLPVLSRSLICGTALLFALLLDWQVRNRLELFLEPPDFAHTKRSQLQELIKRNEIMEGDSVFLYVKGSDDDARYFFYLTRYELWTEDVLVVQEDDFAQNWQKIKDYDKLVIWEADKNTDWYLEMHGFSQYLGMDKTVVTN